MKKKITIKSTIHLKRTKNKILINIILVNKLMNFVKLINLELKI
jgi:hypothetical protein